MTNRRRSNDGSGLVKGLLKRPALQPGCVDGTHRSPCYVLHTGVRIMRTPWASRFTYRWGPGSRESVSSAVRVWDFTYTLGVVFYNRGDLTGL